MVRPWIRNTLINEGLAVNIVIKLHEGAVRFSDERLKELRGPNGRPGSLETKYEAESIEQPNLKPIC